MRVGPNVNAAACWEMCRSHMVNKNKWANAPCVNVGNNATY